MKAAVGYRPPHPGTQPNHLHPPYVSSLKRSPTQHLVQIPYTLSEITGPLLSAEFGRLAVHSMSDIRSVE